MPMPRSLDDLILDGIVAKIAAHRDADAELYPETYYDVERDRTSPWQDLSRPLVNCELESDTPSGRDYTARFRVACLVPTLDEDAVAVSRLSLLKEQVRRALLDRSDPDLGQTMGEIGRISRPTWTRIAFDDAELDTTILAGSWTLEVIYAYEPADIDGPALDSIAIDTGRFAALYNLGGQPT